MPWHGRRDATGFSPGSSRFTFTGRIAMARATRPYSSPPSDASKPQPQESSSKHVAPGESAVPDQPAKPDYNPLDSEKDVEVGLFYMHKGDVDAAIPRFEDAIRLRDNYAEPRLLLGEAYEKKHDKANAVKYYKEYLKVYPTAPDAKKIQEKIDKLSGK